MSEARRVRIWDWPTRAFHWAIVCLVPLLWWTAEEEMMDRHRLLGLVMLGLLAFRILWGLIGSSTARFSTFLRGPRAVWAYLGGRAAHVLGHNPLGGWSVAAMLAALTVQVSLGLFASDEDGLVTGPLARFVSYDVAEEIAELHEAWFDVLLVLIGLHVAAILFYAIIRRRDLVGPMVTGRGTEPGGAAEMRPAPRWRLVLASALAAAFAWWIAKGARL